MRWQHWTKAVLALGALAVAVAVGLTIRRRDVPPPAPPVVRTDPKAIVESTGGRAVRFNRAHEDIRVEYERQLTYKDGSTKLLGVKIAADDRGDGRRFVVTGDEGQVAKDEAIVALDRTHQAGRRRRLHRRDRRGDVRQARRAPFARPGR